MKNECTNFTQQRATFCLHQLHKLVYCFSVLGCICFSILNTGYRILKNGAHPQRRENHREHVVFPRMEQVDYPWLPVSINKRLLRVLICVTAILWFVFLTCLEYSRGEIAVWNSLCNNNFRILFIFWFHVSEISCHQLILCLNAAWNNVSSPTSWLNHASPRAKLSSKFMQ